MHRFDLNKYFKGSVKSKMLFLAYPDQFPDKSYRELKQFYDELLSILPKEVVKNVIVCSNDVKNELEMTVDDNTRIIVVDGFKDIWVRDFMGFNVNGKIVRANYKPTYQKDFYTRGYLNKLDKQISFIYNRTQSKKVKRIDLNWDGGNLVTNGKVGFMTDKIIRDNPNKSKSEITNIIGKVLNIKPILIPQANYDGLGHIDGLLSFKDHKTIFMSKYPDWYYERDKEYLEMVREIIERESLEVNEIYDRPIQKPIYKNENDQDDILYSARGIYVNFLNIDGKVIMPTFNNIPRYVHPKTGEIDKTDYNKENHKVLSDSFHSVSKINCDLLGNLGGGLNCICFTC